MKKILGLAIFAIVCLAFSSCAATTKVPSYPDGDSNSKIVFGEMKACANKYHVTVVIPVFNQTQHDWAIWISCDWYNGYGNKVVEGSKIDVVKSGSKKNFKIVEFYPWDGSSFLGVECKSTSGQILP